jgi:predicted LPLAT superfamily acyltransferase
MKTSGGLTEPLIKAVIYGAVAGIIAFIWSLLSLGPIGSGLFGGAFGIMILFGKIIGSIVGLFIGAIILLVISSICKGSTDFEANIRVTAAVMVVMPISAFLGFSIHINFYLGSIISIAVSLFALWLLYNGLVEALKSNPETTKIVTYVLIAIFVVFILIGLGARRRARQFMNEFNNKDVKEMMKDMPKN